MDKPDQMTVAQLKTILDRYPDNALVDLWAYLVDVPTPMIALLEVEDETIMEWKKD